MRPPHRLGLSLTGPIRRWLAAAILVGAVGACGPLCGNGKLNLSNAHINPTSFTCPSGADNYAYDVKGTVDADNQSSKSITIKSLETDATVTKLNGSWGISVGQKSGASDVTFSPKSVGSGSKTTINFSTPWNCTNTSGAAQSNTYADFALVLTVVTNSGTYKINLPSHRMKMA